MIVINGVTIKAAVEEVSVEPKEYKVAFDVVGKNQFNLYSALIEHSKIKVEIPDFEQNFEAKISKFSSSYTGELDEETTISFKFNVTEKQKGTSGTGSDALTGLFQNSITNWARTRALSKILIQNNLTTEEEYVKLLNEILQSDYKEMKEYILKNK